MQHISIQEYDRILFRLISNRLQELQTIKSEHDKDLKYIYEHWQVWQSKDNAIIVNVDTGMKYHYGNTPIETIAKALTSIGIPIVG